MVDEVTKVEPVQPTEEPGQAPALVYVSAVGSARGSAVSAEHALAAAKGSAGKLHTFFQNVGGVESLVKADLLALLNEFGAAVHKIL